jgi:hypothetical protein
MSDAQVIIGGHGFSGTFEDRLAPQTCSAFRRLLPWRQQIIHVRWSGEACWVPLGDFELAVGPENATARPRPGNLLFYPGGASEAEVLVPYGDVRFACSSGELLGNPLLTITDDLDLLARIGRDTLLRGATTITIKLQEAT